MKKKCVFYGNCQCFGIWTFLLKSSQFMEEYQDKFYWISNYHHLSEQEPLPSKHIKTADLFIYQPLNKRHGQYSTDVSIPNNVLSLLKPECVQISFPYIYQEGIWPIIRPAIADKMIGDFGLLNKYVNREVIINLMDQGKTLDQILKMWDDNQIDFNFRARLKTSWKILEAKEAETTVKVLDLIKKEFRNRRLFFTQNHPTSCIFVHCANQILTHLYSNSKQELLKLYDYPEMMGYQEKTKPWPISKYEVKYWNFKWKCLPDNPANKFYRTHISKIYQLAKLASDQ